MGADIHAVAERAGVSITTVSRALNGKGDRIPRATQDRVRQAAAELGYRPNGLGVSLRAGVAPVLGLVIPDVRNAYFHDIIRGAEVAASEYGCNVILANTRRSSAAERAAVDSLLQQRVAAVLFAGGGVSGDRHLRDVSWGRTRAIAIGSHALDIPIIDWDDRTITAVATEHLISQGCRNIAYLGGQESWLAYQRRLHGYRTCLSAHGVAHRTELEWPAEATAADGASVVARQLQRKLRFDGIIAFSDYLAFGAVRTLLDAGVAVPEEVKVIGCDDVDLCSYVRPSLSSIRLNAYEVAQYAASSALNGHDRTSSSHAIKPLLELQIRQSSSGKVSDTVVKKIGR